MQKKKKIQKIQTINKYKKYPKVQTILAVNKTPRAVPKKFKRQYQTHRSAKNYQMVCPEIPESTLHIPKSTNMYHKNTT